MVRRLQSAASRLTEYFDASPTKVYGKGDLRTLLAAKRIEWNLPTSTTQNKFIDFLLKNTPLRHEVLKSADYGQIERFIWRDASPYMLGLSLKKKSYLSHGTAVFLHSLTDQIPNTVYVNHEQTVKPKPTGSLSQESLNRAFARPQRRSKFVLRNDASRFVLLSGKNTGNLGVINLAYGRSEGLQVTGLERTLIDIVVRPEYSGGVYQILQAYKSAKDRMSVNVLMSQLKQLDYMYPFHQCIGFYMEKAGYEPARWERLRTLAIAYDFYLTHGITEKEYDPSWRLFFPKGL